MRSSAVIFAGLRQIRFVPNPKQHNSIYNPASAIPSCAFGNAAA